MGTRCPTSTTTACPLQCRDFCPRGSFGVDFNSLSFCYKEGPLTNYDQRSPSEMLTYDQDAIQARTVSLLHLGEYQVQGMGPVLGNPGHNTFCLPARRTLFGLFCDQATTFALRQTGLNIREFPTSSCCLPHQLACLCRPPVSHAYTGLAEFRETCQHLCLGQPFCQPTLGHQTVSLSLTVCPRIHASDDVTAPAPASRGQGALPCYRPRALQTNFLPDVFCAPLQGLSAPAFRFTYKLMPAFASRGHWTLSRCTSRDLQTIFFPHVCCAPLQGLSAPAFHSDYGLVSPGSGFSCSHLTTACWARSSPFAHSPSGCAPQAAELSAALCISLQRLLLSLCGTFRRGCPGLQVLALALRAGTSLACPHLGSSLPFRGVRVGEAQNPGPQQDIRYFFRAREQISVNADDVQPFCSPLPDVQGLVTLAVVNPTSIHNKEHLVAAMRHDVVFLSETSAVLKVQQSSTAKFGRLGYKCSWGAPVSAHLSMKTGLDTLRGHAAGVAVCSRLPLHSPCVPLPVEALDTLRITETMSRLGNMQLRLICLYGFPANYRDAKDRNQQLLTYALQRISQSRVPTIVAGDLNCAVQSLPAWEHFRFLGYQEVFEFAEAKMGIKLPPTCKNSSRHDTFLLPPPILHVFRGAQVQNQVKSFDAHDPLVIYLQSEALEVPLRWKQPRPWTDFSPDMDLAARHYDALRAPLQEAISQADTEQDASAAFLLWSQLVEESVNLSLKDSHSLDPVRQPQGFLPRSYRGRCEVKQRLPAQHAFVAKKGRHGDYDPSVEAVSMQSRRQVRQVRRIQSLLQRMQRLQYFGSLIDPSCRKQLQNEWRAILRCKSFGPAFHDWLLRCVHFNYVWQTDPPCDWLADVLFCAKFACESQLRKEAKLRRLRFEYLVQVDISTGSSRCGFKSLRPRPRPAISSLPVQETREAVLWKVEGANVGLYETHHVQLLRAPSVVEAQQGRVTLQSILPGDDDIDRPDLVRLQFDVDVLPPKVLFRQNTQATSPTELHRVFHDFWVDIWWRDSKQAERDLNQWPDFQSMLEQTPQRPPLDLRLLDLETWTRALARLQAHKSTGYDGWSPAELKGLQGAQILDLAALFQLSSRTGFPRHLALARVSTLSKTDHPASMADGRPITIYASIYRLWSSIAARAVLQQWSLWLPEPVSGCVPGRSVQDISYFLQAQIEVSLLEKTPLGGFSLDIIKAFNHVPRAPALQLLRWLGVPREVVNLWQDFLSKSQRCPEFLERGPPSGPPRASRRGTPYPWSLWWPFAGWPRLPPPRQTVISAPTSITGAGLGRPSNACIPALPKHSPFVVLWLSPSIGVNLTLGPPATLYGDGGILKLRACCLKALNCSALTTPRT